MKAKSGKVTGDRLPQPLPRVAHQTNDMHNSIVADTKNYRVLMVTTSQASELCDIFSDDFVQAAVDLGRMKIVDRREALV